MRMESFRENIDQKNSSRKTTYEYHSEVVEPESSWSVWERNPKEIDVKESCINQLKYEYKKYPSHSQISKYKPPMAIGR